MIAEQSHTLDQSCIAANDRAGVAASAQVLGRIEREATGVDERPGHCAPLVARTLAQSEQSKPQVVGPAAHAGALSAAAQTREFALERLQLRATDERCVPEYRCETSEELGEQLLMLLLQIEK